MAAMEVAPRSSKTESYINKKRKDDICMGNIRSARAVADVVHTSLGPKGMDKMISTASGEVIAGALLKQCQTLLHPGIHPTVISHSLPKESMKAVYVLTAMAVPVELSDRESLLKSASTSQYSSLRRCEN